MAFPRERAGRQMTGEHEPRAPSAAMTDRADRKSGWERGFEPQADCGWEMWARPWVLFFYRFAPGGATTAFRAGLGMLEYGRNPHEAVWPLRSGGRNREWRHGRRLQGARPDDGPRGGGKDDPRLGARRPDGGAVPRTIHTRSARSRPAGASRHRYCV